MGEHHSRMNCTLTKSTPLSITSQRFRTWIDMAIKRKRSGSLLASASSTKAAWLPSLGEAVDSAERVPKDSRSHLEAYTRL